MQWKKSSSSSISTLYIPTATQPDRPLPTTMEPAPAKPLSRLRLRAPPSLDLAHVASASAADSVTPDGASGAIPLLSPLAPSPSPETVTQKAEGTVDGRRRDGGEVGVVLSPSGGWQHPAMPALGDPASLGCFLQSQCLIVDPAQ